MAVFDMKENRSGETIFKRPFDSSSDHLPFMAHISHKNASFFKQIFSSDPGDVACSFGTLHG